MGDRIRAPRKVPPAPFENPQHYVREPGAVGVGVVKFASRINLTQPTTADLLWGMSRIGFGVACIALMGAMVGCTTDVEDPGFTASNGMATTDDPGTESVGSTTDDASGTSVNPTTGDSGSSGDPSTTSGINPASSSSGEDPTTGDGGCGDGVVSPGEQCDGADLQGLDCTALGLGTGALGCDPMMCTFDTSMCMSDSGGTSG